MSGPKPPHAFVSSARQSRKRNLDEFAKDLNEIVSKALPQHGEGYSNVAVLTLRWSNDTMGVDVTEKELVDVLEQLYNFKVENYVIDASVARLQASNDFTHALCIYVYSGHGALGTNPSQYLIAGQAGPNGLQGCSFDWVGASSIIQYQEADVLYIFDSCYASQLAVSSGPELLTAANYNSEASTQLNTSFTRVLVNELRALNGSPCSVSHIFGKVHRGALTNLIGQVPIHVPHPTKTSIVLERMNPPIRKSDRLKSMQIEALKGTESRVLISVKMEYSPVPSILNWKKWLATHIPSSVDPSQITIEGQFDIGSSLVLVAMPLALWTCLKPDDTAYNFISVINSGNLLLQPVAGALVDRGRAAGSENTPFASQGERKKLDDEMD